MPAPEPNNGTPQTPDTPPTLDLAPSVKPLARQVIGAVRTQLRTVTSHDRVTLLSTDGLCANPERDPEDWFSDRSRGGQSRLRDRREAARLCHGCPVVRECLEYAIATVQRYGVWGGMSERDRMVLEREALRTPRRISA
jgi:hypothetical protein